MTRIEGLRTIQLTERELLDNQLNHIVSGWNNAPTHQSLYDYDVVRDELKAFFRLPTTLKDSFSLEDYGWQRIGLPYHSMRLFVADADPTRMKGKVDPNKAIATIEVAERKFNTEKGRATETPVLTRIAGIDQTNGVVVGLTYDLEERRRLSGVTLSLPVEVVNSLQKFDQNTAKKALSQLPTQPPLLHLYAGHITSSMTDTFRNIWGYDDNTPVMGLTLEHSFPSESWYVAVQGSVTHLSQFERVGISVTQTSEEVTVAVNPPEAGVDFLYTIPTHLLAPKK